MPEFGVASERSQGLSPLNRSTSALRPSFSGQLLAQTRPILEHLWPSGKQPREPGDRCTLPRNECASLCPLEDFWKIHSPAEWVRSTADVACPRRSTWPLSTSGGCPGTEQALDCPPQTLALKSRPSWRPPQQRHEALATARKQTHWPPVERIQRAARGARLHARASFRLCSQHRMRNVDLAGDKRSLSSSTSDNMLGN